MTANKNQHYVPQFYLKGFSDDDNLYVYDIKKFKNFKTIVRNIGSENYYHNIDESIIKAFYNVSQEDFIDDVLNKTIENYYSKFIKDYMDISVDLNKLRHGDVVKFDNQLITILIDYMIVQYIRSKKFRNYYHPVGHMILDDLSMQNIDISLKEDDYTQITHLNMIYSTLCTLGYADYKYYKFHNSKVDKMHQEFILNIKGRLRSYGKCFITNETTKTLLTSDSPVIFEWTNKGNNDFSIAYFPINKGFGILFFDIDRMNNIREYINGILPITESKLDILDNLNLYIVRGANRFVYNKTSDFSLLSDFINGKRNFRLVLY